MKVAVITQDFSGFSGSEIIAMEVANYFARRGNAVTIRAERYSDALRPFLSESARIAERRIDIADFDLVWSHHGHFALNTSDLRKLKNWKGRFISVHLSATTPGETYHHYFASRYALCRVYNSSETLVGLESKAPRVGKSFNLKNASPREFHRNLAQPKKTLGKLLVVSNHCPIELLDAMVLLKSKSIDVTHLGLAGTYKLIRPEDLVEVDAVVTIGKTTQYALCSTRPVYCYDHFGGPGWLTQENFDIAEYQNFSGRSHPKKKSALEIVEELVLGFEGAQRFVKENWQVFCDRYDLEKHLDEIMTMASENLFNSDKCLKEIDLMRGALVHFDWIWSDVFAKDKVENAKTEVEAVRIDAQRRIAELEAVSRRQLEDARKRLESTENQAKTAESRMVVLRSKLEKSRSRVAMLESALTNNLEKPWLPFKDMLLGRAVSFAGWAIKPLSLSASKRLKKAAKSKNPRRYKTSIS
jgi:hypothetical protein